jgi:hypothetical protein
MEFRDFAAKETSALLTRLFASHAKSSVQHVQSLRKALEAATKALESALNSAPEAGDDLEKLVEKLSKAATVEADAANERAFEEARVTIEAARSEMRALAAERDKLADERDKLSARVVDLESVEDTLRAEMQARVNAMRADLQAQAETLRAEAKTYKERAEAARAELAPAKDAAKKAEAARAEADAARKHEQKAKMAVESELQEVRELLDTTLADAGTTAKKLEAEVAQKAKLAAALSAAQSQLQTLEAQRQTIAALSKANAARIQTLERTHGDADRRFASLLQEVIGGFQSLSNAGTIAEVLTNLVTALSSEFSRVALFCVRGNRLEGEHQVGFDFKGDITNVAMPLGVDSMLTRAASSGRIERLTAADLKDSNRAPFGGSPSCALALPITVQDETLAVVYADDSGQPHKEAAAGSPDVRARFAELLLRHTDVLMTRLTAELKTVTELREYASMLVSEAEKMYDADVTSGRKEKEVRNRLKDNIEYARRTYAERASMEGPAAASLLDERIAQIIEERSDSHFGRDLAAIAGGRSERGSRRTAEAS